jgi:hypothetical protein
MNHCKPSILPLKGVGCCIIEFLDCTIKQGTDKYLRQRRQKAGAFFLKTTEAEPSAELAQDTLRRTETLAQTTHYEKQSINLPKTSS